MDGYKKIIIFIVFILLALNTGSSQTKIPSHIDSTSVTQGLDMSLHLSLGYVLGLGSWDKNHLSTYPYAEINWLNYTYKSTTLTFFDFYIDKSCSGVICVPTRYLKLSNS